MSVLRPDFPQGTFDTISVDQGITDTNAPGTVEAVSIKMRVRHLAMKG